MSAPMEVLLRANLENLGRRGEVVRVRPGYARNYLFPKGLATEATRENQRQLDAQKERFFQEEMRRVEEFRHLADKLQALGTLVIEARASGEGHLYGSVGPATIAAELHEKGFELETRSIRIEEPVKRLGVCEIPIQLHPDVKFQMKLWVVEEGAEVRPEDAPPLPGEVVPEAAAGAEEGVAERESAPPEAS
jgi:large subunit ribosomal protein L9